MTFDPDVRDHAQDLGIPVFDSVDLTPEAIWLAADAATPAFEKTKPDRERLADPPHLAAARRKPATALGEIRTLDSICGRYSGCGGSDRRPRSQRHRRGHPQDDAAADAVPVWLDPEADTLTADNHIPAERRSLDVSGELRIPASGKISVPASPAEGTVVFTNLGQDSITLPSGTGVRADTPDQPRFVTQVPVTLVAGAGSQATVAVRAAQDGTQGNVPAESIGSIEGPLGLQVSVTNRNPLGAGAESVKPAVTPTDLRQLDAQPAGAAPRPGCNRFLEANWAMARPGLRPACRSTVHWTRTLTPNADDVAQSVSLTLKLEVSGLIYHPQTVQAAGLRALAAEIPQGKQPVPGTASASAVPVVDRPELLDVTAKESLYDDLPRQELIGAIAGQPPEAVTGLIASRYPGAAVALDLRPTWLPRLPWLPTRIVVRTAWEGR